MRLSLDNIHPVEQQLVIQKLEKKTEAGIILTEKKDKFIKAVVKKVGNKCKFRSVNDTVYVLSSKAQSLSIPDIFLVDERNAIVED